MGIAERKIRQRAELREQILVTARDIVAREGYEALTMRKIADAIEYSPATIYVHFPSREAIGRQLVREGFVELLHYFVRAAEEADPLDRLAAIGRSYVRFGLEHPEQYKLIFMTDARYTEAIFDDGAEHDGLDEPATRAFETLVSAVKAAQANGSVVMRTPEAIAETLWCGAHGIVSMALNCRDALTQPVDDLSETMLQALLRGFAP